MVGLQAWLGQSGDSPVIVEENNFQGSRPEVLRPVSKTSAAGVAASIFWNVNGLVIFSAARKGKIVCSVELLSCDPAELPRALRRLAAQTEDDHTNLVALGAAMVEQFTGVQFDQATIDQAIYRTLTPVPEDLETCGPEGSPLRHYAPDVVAAIVAARPSSHRALANWAATAAAAEADLLRERIVRDHLEQFAGSERVSLPPTFGPLLSGWERDMQRWDNEHESYSENPSTGAIEGDFLRGRIWAGRALKAATHPDALEAALQATFDALWTFRCTHTKRPGTWVETETKRYVIYDDVGELSTRCREFVSLVLEALSRPEPDWAGLTARLPRPFTEAERQEFMRIDQQLQRDGAFTTVDYVWTEPPPPT
jgi:hypothetical protein